MKNKNRKIINTAKPDSIKNTFITSDKNEWKIKQKELDI